MYLEQMKIILFFVTCHLRTTGLYHGLPVGDCAALKDRRDFRQSERRRVVIQGDLKCTVVASLNLSAWEPYCSARTRGSKPLQNYTNTQLVSSSFWELKGVIF